MENNVKEYAYYDNLSLEEALKVHRACFDDNGNVIDQEKLIEVMGNKKLQQFLFSRERLEELAKQEKSMAQKSAAESFLGKAYPPSWYWKMPDYYYPGLYTESLQHCKEPPFFKYDEEIGKIMSTTTRNEAVLNDCGWERRKYDVPEYFNKKFPNLKILLSKDDKSVFFVLIDPETSEEHSRFQIPFSLLCGLFLKCRELEFDKPWELRAHDYKDFSPDVFEEDHGIVRDKETHEIIDYGDWIPDLNTNETE